MRSRLLPPLPTPPPDLGQLVISLLLGAAICLLGVLVLESYNRTDDLDERLDLLEIERLERILADSIQTRP